MKKKFIFYFIFFIFFDLALCREIIKTSKIMQIEENGSFFFSKPAKIVVADNGEIFVAGKRQLLRFSAAGKYLGNLFKYGQGPGELLNLENFTISNSYIFINQFIPHKIVILKQNGKFIKEFKAKKPMQKLIRCYNKNCLMLKYEIPFKKIKKKISYLDVSWRMFEVNFKGDVKDYKMRFNTEWLIIRGVRGIGANEMDHIKFTIYENKYLYLNNRRKYRVKVVDIKTSKIVKEIKRKYISQKINNAKKEKKGLEKYYDDIRKLLIVREKLWIITSTVNKEKGILVHEYNPSGKFVKSFYLKVEGINSNKDLQDIVIASKDELLFILFKTNDKKYFLSAYKII